MFKRAAITMGALVSRRCAQKVLLLLVLTGLVGATATADTFTLFSTGNGSTTDGTVDPHWTYTSSGNTTANAFVANNPGVDFWTGSSCYFGPCGPWLPDSASSSWIVDNTGGVQSGGLPLRFSTTFDLTGLDPSTASLALEWAIDDAGDLILNGHVVDSLHGTNSGNNWRVLHSVTVDGSSGDFLPGLNTLSLVLDLSDNFNEGGRLQVDQATASRLSAVPEPASIVLLVGIGLLILPKARRRRPKYS